MADGGLPKLNVAPLLAAPLSMARGGYEVIVQATAKYAIADKLSTLRNHKVVAELDNKKPLLLAVVGLVLVFHGAQFKNILLCAQVVAAFLYDRVERSVSAICADIQSAQEKLKADSDDNKPKEKAEATKKALKFLNSEKLSAATVEVLASGMACLLVLHGGLAQKIAITTAFVGLLFGRVEALIEFQGHEDIKAWTSLFLHLALYAVVLPMSFIAPSLALAMDAAACGAHLATEHGVRYLAVVGRVKDADQFLASKQGFFAIGGLMALGTFWQVWTLMSGAGMAWYFTVLYFPAVIVEALLGLL